MKPLSNWNWSLHRIDHALHWPWQHQLHEEPPTGSLVVSVALLSVAAAAVLVLMP